VDRNRVHHARATSNLEALFPSLCHFTFKKALEYEISCFCGMIYARHWPNGVWVIGEGGGSGGIAIKLGHKTEYTFECFKVHAKTRRRKKKKSKQTATTHTNKKSQYFISTETVISQQCIVARGCVRC